MFAKWSGVRRMVRQWARMPQQLEQLQRAVGRIEMRQTAGAVDFRGAEFQVSSQWGEDGIIQYLLGRVPIARPLFVEFGVEDYREANTRFLLQQCNWCGLVIDGSAENVAAIRNDPIAWRHSLKSVSAFIDASNINQLLAGNGISGDIGLLSIDIDGNDYWVWQALDVVSPRIVICEYNGIFGSRAKVTVPYDPAFVRSEAHASCLLAGASLAALEYLGTTKGYRLVATNLAGNNAFFVRNDVAVGMRALRAAEAYVPPRFREARNPDGTLALLDLEDARALIKDCTVIDVESNERIRVGAAV